MNPKTFSLISLLLVLCLVGNIPSQTFAFNSSDVSVGYNRHDADEFKEDYCDFSKLVDAEFEVKDNVCRFWGKKTRFFTQESPISFGFEAWVELEFPQQHIDSFEFKFSVLVNSTKDRNYAYKVDGWEMGNGGVPLLREIKKYEQTRNNDLTNNQTQIISAIIPVNKTIYRLRLTVAAGGRSEGSTYNDVISEIKFYGILAHESYEPEIKFNAPDGPDILSALVSDGGSGLKEINLKCNFTEPTNGQFDVHIPAFPPGTREWVEIKGNTNNVTKGKFSCGLAARDLSNKTVFRLYTGELDRAESFRWNFAFLPVLIQ